MKNMKISKILKKTAVWLVLLAVVATLFSCDGLINRSVDVSSASPSSATMEISGNASVAPVSELPDGGLRVHYIDINQGDAIFIELPNGECLLIDCGEREFVGRVISLIDCLGYKKIDYLVVTHPHTDHMGGMSAVVDSFEIGDIYMPNCTANTDAFLKLLTSIENKGLKINEARDGVKIDLGNGARADFYGPITIDSNLNNCSAVIKLSYGSKSFLFTGDAESAEEASILAKYANELKSDVLKVGHHGSRTSSSAEFLKAVGAGMAVISCGNGNSYGHPHSEAMARLNKAGIGEILRTDLSGTITVSTDGNDIGVSTGTPDYSYKWVLNISGMKIHTPKCSSSSTMAERNKAYSARALKELEKQGYTRCKSCNPEE